MIRRRDLAAKLRVVKEGGKGGSGTAGGGRKSLMHIGGAVCGVFNAFALALPGLHRICG